MKINFIYRYYTTRWCFFNFIDKVVYVSITILTTILSVKNPISLKPWPNGVANYRKFGNANLRTQACDGWPNAITSIHKLDASHKKPCSHMHTLIQVKIILRPTCINFLWVAIQWKTWANLRANLILDKVNASHRKLLQVHASSSQIESQVSNLQQLATLFGQCFKVFYMVNLQAFNSTLSLSAQVLCFLSFFFLLIVQSE